MVTLGSLLLIGLMVGLGYRRGVTRLGVAFVALLMASFLASPLHFLTAWAVKAAGAPRLLAPSLSTLTTGLLLFVLLLIPSLRWAKARLGEERPAWDAPLGAFAGAVWGLILVLLSLTGLTAIARVDRAMRVGTAESAIRAEARRTFERQAEEEMRPLRTTMTRARYASEKQKLVAEAEEAFFVEPAELRERAGAGPLEHFLVDLEHSPFEAMVDNVSPVTVDTEKTLRDLTIVVGDPVLFARFREHPTVSALMKEPAVVALSQDPEIAETVIRGDYRALLDHPKLIEAVEEPAIREAFSNVDITTILAEVRAHERK